MNVQDGNAEYMCLPDWLFKAAKHGQPPAMQIIVYTTDIGAPHWIDTFLLEESTGTYMTLLLSIILVSIISYSQCH